MKLNYISQLLYLLHVGCFLVKTNRHLHPQASEVVSRSRINHYYLLLKGLKQLLKPDSSLSQHIQGLAMLPATTREITHAQYLRRSVSKSEIISNGQSVGQRGSVNELQPKLAPHSFKIFCGFRRMGRWANVVPANFH